MDHSMAMILVALAGAFTLPAIVFLLVAKRSKPAKRNDDFDDASMTYSGDDEYHPALHTARRRRFVGAPTHHARTPVPPRRVPEIILSPRQLERVNIQRRINNKRPMNRAGFSNAIAHAWDQPHRQPDTTSDWLTYLILYECFFSDHQSNRVAVDTSIMIAPDQPYNGQGGEYAGAGASGNWTAAPTEMAAAAAAIALAPSYSNGSDGPSSSQATDPSSDSGSSYSSSSSDSSSSSSSSSDSGSSSGGGDSGGGGGGGGGGGSD